MGHVLYPAVEGWEKQSQRHPLGSGSNILLPWGCIVVILMIECWIGLGPKFHYSTSNPFLCLLKKKLIIMLYTNILIFKFLEHMHSHAY